jgi:glycosyltransferase involved in cell wall biosynthesis
MNGLFVRLVAPRKYNDRIVSGIRNSLRKYDRSKLLAERLLVRRSYVVANTRSAAMEFADSLPVAKRNRVSWIYNGFDTNVFKPEPRTITRDAQGLLLGCVGRVCLDKNQMQVVRLVRELNDDRVKLMIIGKFDDQKDLIERYIRDNRLESKVLLVPQQANIAQYYSKFDIFILPSLVEGCPNVLFEAMLCRCFCIISSNANTDDFVVQEENGLIYDGTAESLRKTFEFATSIRGSEAFDKIRENGRQYALQHFSIEKMVKSYESLYCRMLGAEA